MWLILTKLNLLEQYSKKYSETKKYLELDTRILNYYTRSSQSSTRTMVIGNRYHKLPAVLGALMKVHDHNTAIYVMYFDNCRKVVGLLKL